MAQILVVGGGGGPAHAPRPIAWAGHEFVPAQGRFDTFGDHTSPARDEVRIDEAGLAAFVAEAAHVDVVLAETRECLLLWAHLPTARRPAFLALDQDVLTTTQPVRRYLAAAAGTDPWPDFCASPATTFIVNAAAHRAPLVAAGVPAERIFLFPSSTGAFAIVMPDTAAMFAAAALDSAGEGLPTGGVVAAGTGQRDHPTLLAAARDLPDVPFVVVDPTLPRHADKLAAVGLWDLRNVTRLEPLPLPRFAALLSRARLAVVALLPGAAAGGHLTVALAQRVGTPVIASDVAGLAGYATDGHDAWLVPPANPAALAHAVAALWRDAPLCARLGDAGRTTELSRVAEGMAGLRAAIAHGLRGRVV